MALSPKNSMSGLGCAAVPLSGVGNAEELRRLHIDVVHDLPGVGENLQDHLEVYVQYRCPQPVSLQPMMARKLLYGPYIAARWLLTKTGPGATNHFEAGGFARSNDEVTYPNLMFHFLPIAVRYDGSQPEGGHGWQLHVGPMYSDAIGSVKLRSNDPFEKPALYFCRSGRSGLTVEAPVLSTRSTPLTSTHAVTVKVAPSLLVAWTSVTEALPFCTKPFARYVSSTTCH